MGDVIQMADRRQPAPADPKQLFGLERTPELALLLALYNAVPVTVRRRACITLLQIGQSDPDCEASQAAARLAGMLSKIGGA